jgi:[methyl-Co(III) methanol-specific corrinoid protein]:coenzyme M methyltransferase
VLNALNGKEVDMAPVANPNSIVTREMQDRVGAYFPEAHHNAEVMTELALAGHTLCGYDNVFPVFGAGTQEAGALGCPIDWGDPDNLPAILGRIWNHPDQIRVPDDYLERPEIRTVIDSIRMLKQEVGDRVAVFGKAYGPWSLAYHLFGIEPFLMDTFRDPPKVDAIMRGLKELQLVFAKAQIEAGADALNVCEHITGDLIRPGAYERFLLKIDQEVAKELSVPIILHCCGKTLDRVHLFNQNGFAAFNFESANNAIEMRSQASMVLVGNINNPRTILEGTPADVEREVFYALDAGVEIIAPECAAPVNGKLANVTAVREARDKYYEQGRHEKRPVIERKVFLPGEAAGSQKASKATRHVASSPSLQAIYDAIVAMKQDEVAEMVKEELAKGTDVQVVLDDALIAAMKHVGDLFAEGSFFVPEMLLSALGMKKGLEIVRPILTDTGAPPKGTVLLGTVKGDVHDIGKNVVGMMLEGAGYTIVDIGVRNSAEDFLTAIEKHKPDIIGMSAMLTTTMAYMKVVVDEMIAAGIRDDHIVLVGGAPLTEEFGQRVGADAFCEDANSAVVTADTLLAASRGITPFKDVFARKAK